MGKSIRKNLLYQSLYQILMVISPLITSPYIARTLGNEKYGTYSFYYSVAYYFGIFAILGMVNYGNRTIAKVKSQGRKALGKIFSELVLVQFIMTGIVSILYFTTIPFWGGDYKSNAIIAFCGDQLPLATAPAAVGRRRMHQPVKATLLRRAATIF